MSVQNYESDWREYRRLVRRCLLIWLGYLPVCGLAAYVGAKLLDSFKPVFVVWLFWVGLLLYYGNAVQGWRCPRCGEWFFRTSWINWPLARRCLHCGLPKYAKEGQEFKAPGEPHLS